MTTALITGANKGLGFQTASELAELGWTVWLGARNEQRGAAAAAALADKPGHVRFVQLDVTSDESVDAAATTLEDAGDGLDVLINNAGIIGPGVDVAHTQPTDFLACFGVNLLGPVRVTNALMALLARSAHPRIVMVSSGMGSITVTTDPDRLESSIHNLVYSSSKAALNMVTTQYAKAFPDIAVNAADPGYTATDLNANTGHNTVEQGARIIVQLATADAGGSSGGFFDVNGPVPW